MTMKRMSHAVLAFAAAWLGISPVHAGIDPPADWFELDGLKAFTIEATRACAGGKPWVWYAPTFFNTLPAHEDEWLLNEIGRAGVSVAGIDIGESYGSPAGADQFQKLYSQMVAKGFSPKPALLARSRGALMHFAWATRHSASVAAIGGIYPVLNLESFPGLAAAAAAYGMTAEDLRRDIAKFSPFYTAEVLVNAHTPIYIVHGTADSLVPLADNAQLLIQRYPKAVSAHSIIVDPIAGEGHNISPKFFENRTLARFLIANAELGAGCT
jgi:pimeloyl-ACP methyl ester carboxylesterase